MTTETPYSVQCPSCRTWFPVDPAKVPEEGVPAICSECHRVFRVERPRPEVSGMAESEPSAGDSPAIPLPGEVAPEDPWKPEAGADALEVGWEAPREKDEQPSEPTVPYPPLGALEGEDTRLPVDPGRGVDPGTVGVSDREEAADGEQTLEPRGEAPSVDDVGDEEPVAVEDASEPVEEPPPALEEEPDRWDEGGSTAEGSPEPEEGLRDGAAPKESTSPVQDQSLSTAAARFGRRDPHDRAKRLARVLVSDMLTYHPARYEEALAGGTLREDFDEEIRLSWEEYEEQIGRELAESTDYFVRALNEILARGEDLFRGTGRPR